jgi:hypothetical protein
MMLIGVRPLNNDDDERDARFDDGIQSYYNLFVVSCNCSILLLYQGVVHKWRHALRR